MLILNYRAETFNIEAGDRIAQFVLTRYETPDIFMSDLEQTICDFKKNLLNMLHVSDHSIMNIMDMCHNENGFILSSVHSDYGCCAVTKDMINELLRIKACIGYFFWRFLLFHQMIDLQKL